MKQITHLEVTSPGGFTSTTFSLTHTIHIHEIQHCLYWHFQVYVFELNYIGLHIPSQGAEMRRTRHC